MARLIVRVLGLFLVMLAAGGQGGVQVSPPAGATPRTRLVFPFSEWVGKGDWILVPVKIAEKEHLFLVDTGCGVTILDTGLAKSLPVALAPADSDLTLHTPGGGSVKIPVYRAPRVELGGERIWLNGPGVVGMIDMKPMREASGREVEGILGMDALSQYVLRVDFRAREVELIEPALSEAPPAGKAVEYPLVSMEGDVGAMFPMAGLPERPIAIDTGDTGMGSLAGEWMEKAAGAGAARRWKKSLNMAGEMYSQEVRVDRPWTLAGTTFREVWLEKSTRNEVGLKFLANYVVTMDFPRMRFYLESVRAEHPREMPRLDFSVASTDGKIFKGARMESPAALGMPAEEEVVSVDGRSVAGMNEWGLEELLRQGKVSVLGIRSEGQVRDVMLHPPAATSSQPATTRVAAPKLEFPLGPGVGRGDLPCVAVMVGGKERLFVLAIGSPGTVFDTQLAKSLGEGFKMPPQEGSAQDGTAMKLKASLSSAPRMEIGGQPLRLQSPGEVMVMDLSRLSESLGRPLDGILGMNVLMNYVVRMDFRRRVVELRDPVGFEAAREKPGEGFELISIHGAPAAAMPFEGVGDVPVVLSTANRGSGTIAPPLQKQVAEVGATTRSYEMSSLDEATTIAVEVCVRRKWMLAGTSYENVWLEQSQWNSAGLRILSNYVATFDFPRMRLYLESIRAEQAPEPPLLEFGIGMREGRFYVRFPDERGKALGIVEGDELLRVDGKAVAGMEIWALREQLRMAAAPVVALRRGGQVMEITLRRGE